MGTCILDCSLSMLEIRSLIVCFVCRVCTGTMYDDSYHHLVPGTVLGAKLCMR